jgi:hypothetical protein
MCRVCSAHGVKRWAYRILVGKPDGKRPLRKPTFGWEDNIKTDLNKNRMDLTALI